MLFKSLTFAICAELLDKTLGRSRTLILVMLDVGWFSKVSEDFVLQMKVVILDEFEKWRMTKVVVPLIGKMCADDLNIKIRALPEGRLAHIELADTDGPPKVVVRSMFGSSRSYISRFSS